MNFFRSIIADARPRKVTRTPLDGLPTVPARKDPPLDRTALGAEQNSTVAPDHRTDLLSKSFYVQEGMGDAYVGDAPAFKVDNPLNQGIQEMRHTVELESPLAVSKETSEPIPDEKSTVHLDPANSPEQPLDSRGYGASKAQPDLTSPSTIIPDSRLDVPKGLGHDCSTGPPETRDAQPEPSGHEHTVPAGSLADLRELPVKSLTDRRHMPSLQPLEDIGPLDIEPPKSPAADGKAPSQGAFPGVRIADDQQHADPSAPAPDAITIQADATQTTDAASTQSRGSTESRVFQNTDPASAQDSMPVNLTRGNMAENTRAHAGKARPLASRMDKQVPKKSPAMQKDIPQTQETDAPKDRRRDVQPVSRQSVVMAPSESWSLEPAPVPQTAGHTDSASDSSPGAGSSRANSAVQHGAGPAKPRSGPDVLWSVPARPFHPGSIPKDRDAVQSSSWLRSPDKKPEAPRVQIGQIDVIIQPTPQSTAKSAPAPLSTDLASRHYLRRL